MKRRGLMIGDRLAACSDGVIAIIVTIMVLGMLTAIADRLLGTRLSSLNAGSGIVDEVGSDRRRKNSLALLANVLAVPTAYRLGEPWLGHAVLGRS